MITSVRAVVSLEKQPNIVVLLMDDVGMRDLGPFPFTNANNSGVNRHGRDIEPPFYMSLQRRGVSLGNYYTHALCTPSRAALLSGKYAMNTGKI